MSSNVFLWKHTRPGYRPDVREASYTEERCRNTPSLWTRSRKVKIRGSNLPKAEGFMRTFQHQGILTSLLHLCRLVHSVSDNVSLLPY